MRLRTFVVSAAAAFGLVPVSVAAMGGGNLAPVVDSVSVSPSPAAADATATITCAAHDADGQVAKLTVSVSGGILAASGGPTADVVVTAAPSVSADVQWLTPPAGAYTVSCKATDNYASFGGPGVSALVSLPVTVEAAAAPPVVDLFTGPNGSVAVGSTSDLTVTAHDPSGGALTYAWTATGGTLQPSGETAKWTAPDVGGPYTVTVTVSNAAGQVTKANLIVMVAMASNQGAISAVMVGPRRVASSPANGDLFAVNGRTDLAILTRRGDLKGFLELPGRGTAVAATDREIIVALSDGRLVFVNAATGRQVRILQLDTSYGPSGMSWDAARQVLWLAERQAGRARAITLDGTTVASFSNAGDAALVSVADVAVDAARGVVWAAMDTNQVGLAVHAFTVDGVYTGRSVASFGASLGMVQRVGGIAVDGSGRVYVSDSVTATVQIFLPDATPSGSLGEYGTDAGDLRQPAGMTFLGNGDLLVANADLGRFERFGSGAPLPTCAGDSDCDGLPDSWETAHGLNPLFAGDAFLDLDGDGLNDAEELARGTDPRKADTDGDGFDDGTEILAGDDPLNPNDHKVALAASGSGAQEPGLVKISATVTNARTACSYAWSQLGGPSVSLRGATTLTPSFVARAAATYLLKGVATCGTTTSDPAMVEVLVKNVAPRADSGRIFVTRATTITLDGRWSRDVNGDALTFAWDQLAGAPLIGTSSGPIVTVRAHKAGYYAFQVTARDAAGLEGTAEVPVLIVKGQGAPTAVAQSPLSGRVGQPVALDAAASVATNATFAWQQVDGPAAILDDPAAPVAVFVPASPGRYVFEVAVSEDDFRSPPARVEVFVGASASGLPVASIAPVAPVDVGAVVELDGGASTAVAGGTLEYAWQQVAGPAAGLTDSTGAVATVVPFEAGSYVFELESAWQTSCLTLDTYHVVTVEVH